MMIMQVNVCNVYYERTVSVVAVSLLFFAVIVINKLV